LISLQRPYGVDRFGQAGGRLGVVVDRRDDPPAATKGGLLSLEGTYYPRVWSATDAFGEVRGEAAVLAPTPIPSRPTLALRAGGQKVFGRYPFHEAAYLGGGETVRGLPRQRYAGDASAYGNAELRFPLRQRPGAAVPRFGVFGLADVGRVFLKGESSDRWHTAWGGGLWLGLMDHTASLSVARSEGHVRVYLQGGLLF
jgi:hemolysin activation/secretion protein